MSDGKISQRKVCVGGRKISCYTFVSAWKLWFRIIGYLHPVVGRVMATAGSRLHRFWYGAATAAAAIDATTIMLLENSMMTDWLSRGE